MIIKNTFFYAPARRSQKLVHRFLLLTVLFCYGKISSAQTKYVEPAWWFGAAGGVNFNSYSGSFTRANEVTNFPVAFHKGDGRGFFGAALAEYHNPNSRIAFMLMQGVDDRRGTFTTGEWVLYTHLAYISIEPSIKISLYKGLNIFGGPRFGFLATSDFNYKRPGLGDEIGVHINPDNKIYLSSVRKNPISAEVSLAYDYRIKSKDRLQYIISPFVTYFPTMWHKNIRTIERTYLSTIRAGIAVKIGRGRLPIPLPVVPPPPVVVRSDRDGDGIYDTEDKCPDTPGLAKYQGCPIPDTDGDGINDEVDKCPLVKGFVRYDGCPIPDTDGDGINDEEDKCPTLPGPASNRGCPVISREIIDKVNFAARNIFFATGNYQILPKSYKFLDGIVGLLNADNSLMLDINGHTDAQGTDERNQILSENRANAVKEYLVRKGIDRSRLKSTGYGETRPIEDNKTSAGRAMNRRTEMTVRNY